MVINLNEQYNGGFLPDISMSTQAPIVVWLDGIIKSYVAAWVYDSIIYSGVNKRGRDVYCIVGVLGKSSHTL